MEEVLTSPDLVLIVLDFVQLGHFHTAVGVSRAFRDGVRDRRERWRVLQPERVLQKDASGVSDPCHAVTVGGDRIGVLDAGGPCVRTFASDTGEFVGAPLPGNRGVAPGRKFQVRLPRKVAQPSACH